MSSLVRICLLASGSNGNACLVEARGVRLLVDAGLGPRRLAARLSPLGLQPASITDVLVTHAHDDHVAGLTALVDRQPELRLHATADTARELPAPLRRRVHRVRAGRPFDLGSLSILPFSVAHDAPGSLGFRVEGGAGAVGYATDLGRFDAATVEALRGCDALVVEANHCPTMLACGPYPRHLKRRVAGPLGHLSNQQSCRLLEAIIDGRTRHVILAHLSAVNNEPAVVRAVMAELVAATPDVTWAIGSRSGALEPLLLDGRRPRQRAAPATRQLFLPFE
jgi:phosphoribosyl 1,2-cyclic phosphodiesterase